MSKQIWFDTSGSRARVDKAVVDRRTAISLFREPRMLKSHPTLSFSDQRYPGLQQSLVYNTHLPCPHLNHRSCFIGRSYSPLHDCQRYGLTAARGTQWRLRNYSQEDANFATTGDFLCSLYYVRDSGYILFNALPVCLKRKVTKIWE